MYFVQKLSCLLLSLILLALLPAKGLAEPPAYQIIRVGIANDRRPGPANDAIRLLASYNTAYLAEIAKITHWQYEIYHGSAADCLQRLRDGRLDLVAPVCSAAFADENFLFSDGYSCYAVLGLYARGDNTSIDADYAATINGSTIGLLASDDIKSRLQFYINANGWSVTLRTYPSGDALNAALQKGEIQLMASTVFNLTGTERWVSFVTTIPQQYLTTPAHTTLMSELNQAILNIEMTNPSFETRLEREYLDPSIYKMARYSEQQQAYIRTAPTVRVIFPGAFAPLVQKNNDFGNIYGIAPDILTLLMNATGIVFQPSIADSYDDAIRMLHTHDAEAMFAVYVNDPKLQFMQFSNNILWLPFTPIIARTRSDSARPEHIVLPTCFTGLRDFFQRLNPQAKVTELADPEECLYAVEQGQYDCTYLPQPYLSKNKNVLLHFQLKVLESTTVSVPLCLMFRADAPETLCRTVNTALLGLPQNQLAQIIQRNSEPDVSFGYLLSQHPLSLTIGLLIVFTILATAIFLMYRNRLEQEKNRVLRARELELQQALDAVEILQEDRDNYKHNAETDHLTGCLNKAAMTAQCQQILEKIPDNWSAAFFIIDLDHFKEANDTYGHQRGDDILVEFSSMLYDILPPRTHIGRFGGDEFTLLIVQEDKGDCEAYASMLAELILEQTRGLIVSGTPGNVTASIGVAISPAGSGNDRHNLDSIFRRADRALYDVKESCRDSYRIYQH
ncbi:diguanylate cyclase (GGDEF) domain-containing protein [Selenomonas ruminantium]|uniref:Diguanylate cyclase (GGDEF) domain-containing protein n=1 Tax=Selenomonas ruminantium TaxID=971 RepID=A0A1I3GQ35_SELRU|nr:GGDEF domain-containing protein [Selenomonas ruminantium]SFI25536.1 diguanylate cyclase (GGDEF) domain-containing protein [Selenomonas ruminantium]